MVCTMRKRVPITLSFRTQADKAEALQKCKNHNTKISQEMQKYFKAMPEFPEK